MQPQFGVVPMDKSTGYGPLVALGDYVQAHDLLSPLHSRVQFAGKTHSSDPAKVLVDMAVAILAGCEAVSQINTTIRSDPLLAQAWGRAQFSEQSTVARILDACTKTQLEQMRQAQASLLNWTGRVYQHDFAHDWLHLDIDLTGLLASRAAEGSQKGYFADKKMRPADNLHA